MDGERVVYSTADGAVTRHWNVPTVNTSAILLGAGTSLTQGAARRLAEERVMVAFTGSGGTPIFMGSLSEYAPTEHLQAWISFWPSEMQRLKVAKYFARERCRAILAAWESLEVSAIPSSETDRFLSRIDASASIESLRGAEGGFAKALYKVAAAAFRIKWEGRITKVPDEQDLANRFLDQGNYLAYGLAGVVLWTLGVPPGLAVSHGATRAGGLVFDLADVIKDAFVLPNAFRSAAEGLGSQEFRDRLVDDLDRLRVLPLLFDAFDRGIAIGCGGNRP